MRKYHVSYKLNAHFTRSGEVTSTLCSSLKRKGLKKKKGEAPKYAPTYARLASRFARTRKDAFIFLIFPSTYMDLHERTIRRHRFVARFTMSNLSGKDAPRLSTAFPTLPLQDATRAATIPHAVGAQRYPVHPHLYTLTKTWNSCQPHSHRHFGYHLPFADTNLNLAPVANAQSPLTRDIERRDFPSDAALHLTECPRRFSGETWRCEGG